MFDAAKAQAISAHIVSQEKYISKSASPYFERFHGFLNKHQPHPEYVSYPGGSLERLESFILEVSDYSSRVGLVFSGVKPWGDETILMPFEYIDDPDAWETELLERIAKDKAIVGETFTKIFGETDLAVHSVGQYKDTDGNRLLNVYLSTENETSKWDTYISDICLLFSPENRKFYDTFAAAKVIAGKKDAMTAEDIEEFKRKNVKV